MKIAIAGGGIAGLTAALALKQAGRDCIIFESASDLNAPGAGLGLAPNAIAALTKLGLADQILPLGRHLGYFEIRTRAGKTLSKTGNSGLTNLVGAENFTIHRKALQQALLEATKDIPLQTGKKLTGFTRTGFGLDLDFSDGSSFTTDFLVAADGINSPVRKQLFPAVAKRYAGYTCWRGVCDAENQDMNHAVEVWDTSGRLGIVPLRGDQVYWFACINAAPDDPRYTSFSGRDLSKYFGAIHPLAEELLSGTPTTSIIRNDIYDLPPLPGYSAGNILLMGDAAHAATPNMAQGACQAIEDAAVLRKLLSEHVSLEEVFAAFHENRFERTQFIIDQSRKIGSIAQLSNPLLAGLRNLLLPLIPESVRLRQLKTLYEVNF